jgi:hypothetical protein
MITSRTLAQHRTGRTATACQPLTTHSHTTEPLGLASREGPPNPSLLDTLAARLSRSRTVHDVAGVMLEEGRPQPRGALLPA